MMRVSSSALFADLCRPWSDPDDAGKLELAFAVGDWVIHWTAEAEARGLGPGIPNPDFWASDPWEVDQVSRVYAAQGFDLELGRGCSRSRRLPAGVTSGTGSARYDKNTDRVRPRARIRDCCFNLADSPTRVSSMSRTKLRSDLGVTAAATEIVFATPSS